MPGSVHVDKKTGIPDEVSLSTAGRQYLIERGVPESDVHGDDLNLEYKGDAGVYGGDDECFVTAQYYKDGQFGTLHVFGSPAQHDRAWERFVGEHGLYPLFHSVPVSDPFHSNAYEVLVAATRMQEGHGKDAQAAEALRLRLERNPSLARGARPAAVSAAQSAAVSPVPGQGRASQLGAARLAARLQRTRGARTKVSTRAAAVRKLAAAQARARGETTRG